MAMIGKALMPCEAITVSGQDRHQDRQLAVLKMPLKPLGHMEDRQDRQDRHGVYRETLAKHSGPAYSAHVTANPVTGRGNPSNSRRTGAATALFCCVTPRVYGGRVGRASARPGSLSPGFPPRHVRRLHRVETIGGGSLYSRNLR